MTAPYLSVSRLERRFSNGNTEGLGFQKGVNLLIGRPNTGKTKWLQTLDFLLGDVGDHPFQGSEETGLSETYEAAAAEILIGGHSVSIERRWREAGAKTKVFVNGDGMQAREFQHWLMGELGIPILHFPKGNPMSGQTWPELSFRIMLRHIYRQQRFWGGIADQQPEGEQHAALMQFLGLAEHIYTQAYGDLIELRMKAERLKARREQYSHTLNELAKDLLGEPGLSVSVSAGTISAASARIREETAKLKDRRQKLLIRGQERAISADWRGRVSKLGEERAAIIAKMEEAQSKLSAAADRMTGLERYHRDLTDELDRLTRAQDAGNVLADLRITHCPACDQTISNLPHSHNDCFLCHQPLPDEPIVEELGSARLRFEQDRMTGELKEIDQLLELLTQERRQLGSEIAAGEERLRTIERELSPARDAVAALVQEDVSAIDVALGQKSEQERQLNRVMAALTVDSDLGAQIADTERRIAKLSEVVGEDARATDFEIASTLLEDGMNAYLNAINLLRPGVWQHSPVRVDIVKSRSTMRLGARRWQVVLGGTDTLYFLMAYHYGLLTLSSKAGCHYPGISIIDVPGDFAGEAVGDKENFIVQPFIDLLSQPEYEGAQLIMTGAAFAGVEGALTNRLTHVYAA